MPNIAKDANEISYLQAHHYEIAILEANFETMSEWAHFYTFF